jgi:hypothetical protein
VSNISVAGGIRGEIPLFRLRLVISVAVFPFLLRGATDASETFGKRRYEREHPTYDAGAFPIYLFGKYINQL